VADAGYEVENADKIGAEKLEIEEMEVVDGHLEDKKFNDTQDGIAGDDDNELVQALDVAHECAASNDAEPFAQDVLQQPTEPGEDVSGEPSLLAAHDAPQQPAIAKDAASEERLLPALLPASHVVHVFAEDDVSGDPPLAAFHGAPAAVEETIGGEPLSQVAHEPAEQHKLAEDVNEELQTLEAHNSHQQAAMSDDEDVVWAPIGWGEDGEEF